MTAIVSAFEYLIRHVRFEDPLTMIINGRTNSGVVMRPEAPTLPEPESDAPANANL